MRSKCGKKKSGIKHIGYNIKRNECLVAADLYFAAVRTGGGLPMYWDYVNHGFCKKQEWVKDCMP
ncbi:hypothetical protein FSP39_000315 [Pinctada imbricata]|uniref:Uncharacterized protein n=1 Tax=Pinctada imbricata TaxID=66713 RepID=A0AA88XH26_PINIB|nr:hypothetical protein FSP39_000315 [Pinctada imbricata]